MVYWRRSSMGIVVLSAALCLSGCQIGGKKAKKPVPQTTTVVDDGNADAKGKGEGQSDVPLMIGTGKLSAQVNPFAKQTDADSQAVALTQLKLVVNDRQGRIVYHSIDGEERKYGKEQYTYFGPSDVDVDYDGEKGEATYKITIRDDLVFSDSQKITIDDVIFTMYVLCDTSYDGRLDFAQQKIKGLEKYQEGKAPKIAGIKRISDYQMTLKTEGYDKETINALQIPICPLHYYGTPKHYNYQKNKFGFTKGDISKVREGHSSLLGAGAYRFVKTDKGISYFASNESYYKGCPKIAYLQLKEMDDILKKDRKLIAQKLSEQKNAGGGGVSAETPSKTFPREGTSEHEGEEAQEDGLNLVPEGTELSEGTVDVLSIMADAEDYFWLRKFNSDEELDGDVLSTAIQPTQTFYSVGINAAGVQVASKRESRKSKNLRYALAAALQESRTCLEEIYGDSLKKLDYLYAPDSWLYPQEEKKLSGKSVAYYLKRAGYKLKKGKIVKTPKGAGKLYAVGVIGGESHPIYPVLERAAETLAEAGMNLRIVSVANKKELVKKLRQKEIQLWVEENDVSGGRNLLEHYMGEHSSYALKDSGLQEMLRQSQAFLTDSERQECYQRCFEGLEDWCVDVPMFQQCSTLLFSSGRIRMKTMAEETTQYYSWMEEIQALEMKK